VLLLLAAASVAKSPPDGGTVWNRELPTLIVTVIDPLDPRLGYMYHRELDAVLAALNNVGFIKSGRVDGSIWSVDGGVRRGSIDLKRWSHPDGGTLSEHLRLQLVRETQYGGVDVDALRALARANDGGPLYVLGPVLSGSAWSLVAGLRDAPTSKLWIITGSASASDLPQILGRVDAGYLGKKAELNVGATVHSAQELAHGVRHVLCDFCGAGAFRSCNRKEDAGVDGGIDAGTSSGAGHELALFVETSTYYGQSFLSDAAADLHALVLPFPAGLAGRLGQDLLGEHPGQDETDGGTGEHEPGVHRAELNAREAQGALEELLRTLAFEDIRTVGVLATDVRDRVVLVQNIRRLLPGVRVILFESDTLYTQAPEETMRGAIVASTYPLFTENQDWTSGGGTGARRAAMVSDPAQGAYNATLLMLGDMATEGDGLKDAARDLLLEYRPPRFAQHKTQDAPPVWISVLGARGSWPLTAVESHHSAGEEFVEPREQTKISPRWLKRAPTPFRGLVVLTVLWAIGLGLWLLRHEFTDDDLIRGPVREADDASRTSLLWLTILGATSLMLALQGFILHPHPPSPFPVSMEGTKALPLAALVLAFFLPGAVAWRCVPRTPRLAWFPLTVGLIVLFGRALWLMIDGFRDLHPERLALFLVRASHLESGLSPVPPLLLLYLGLLVSFFSVLSIQQLVRRKLFSLLRGIERRIVAAVVAAVWAWYLWTQFRPMLEIPPIGFIFQAVYALAPLTLSWTFVAALQTAASLRGALDSIVGWKTWDDEQTLAGKPGAGRHLVLARAPAASSPGKPLGPGEQLEGASPEQAFNTCRRTAAVLRRRLVRPLFVTPLLVIGLATYPFEPHGVLLLTYGALLTLFVLGTVVVAVQIENHPGAARLRGGEAQARALDLSFLLRVAFGVIPALLTLIGAAMPATGQKVFGAVEQVLSLFK